MSNRDEFPPNVKEALAKRVGFLCSRCGKSTSGPQEDPSKILNIGVAAHITAASPGGPRYDASLTPEQRADISNGIWLCQFCAKMVDNDEKRFRAEHLRLWKTLAEQRQRDRIEGKFVAAADSLQAFTVSDVVYHQSVGAE